jgi:PEP-CTERM motif
MILAPQQQGSCLSEGAMRGSISASLTAVAIAAAVMAFAQPASAGNVFVTGHDPDFHDQAGPNAPGATNIIDDALTFARNGNTAPILFVYTSAAPNEALGDHLDSMTGLIDAGYTASNTPGNHFVAVNAAGLPGVNFSAYSTIFVPSDHGGSLQEQDLAALDARSSDILSYINAGGGLVALAEDNFHSGGTAAPLFGFLPFLVTSSSLSEFEGGNTLTPDGAALGLTTSDINGNFSHNVFTATGGMHVVDKDSGGQILSLDFSGPIGPTGTVPEPGSLSLVSIGLIGLWRLRRRMAK